jgi:hypothetical protein
VREGKLTPERAEELKALASRDIGILAINILMSFGAIAVAAGILALNPTFATGAAIGVALVVIGLAVSFGAGIWAVRANRRWVVTTAATFGAINFYTQWFAPLGASQARTCGWRISDAPELGAEPWAIIVAGLTVVAIAVGLWRYNTAHAGRVPSLAAGA